ncbi:MAG: hypothetical protein M1827_007413 [Pycnora praestabilis]|nr:MAG: hypothetical protein M1827_007413 [Pycnora praestabilis]
MPHRRSTVSPSGFYAFAAGMLAVAALIGLFFVYRWRRNRAKRRREIENAARQRHLIHTSSPPRIATINNSNSTQQRTAPQLRPGVVDSVAARDAALRARLNALAISGSVTRGGLVPLSLPIDEGSGSSAADSTFDFERRGPKTNPAYAAHRRERDRMLKDLGYTESEAMLASDVSDVVVDEPQDSLSPEIVGSVGMPQPVAGAGAMLPAHGAVSEGWVGQPAAGLGPGLHPGVALRRPMPAQIRPGGAMGRLQSLRPGSARALEAIRATARSGPSVISNPGIQIPTVGAVGDISADRTEMSLGRSVSDEFALAEAGREGREEGFERENVHANRFSHLNLDPSSVESTADTELEYDPWKNEVEENRTRGRAR